MGARIPTTIICVDCGGTCHLLGAAADAEFDEGDIVAYRCSDCLDRWDIVVEFDDLDS